MNRYHNLSYQEAICELNRQVPSFQKVGRAAYHPGLETMRQFDQLLGNPHKRYKTIHIAGTNGKGSTAHFIASALMAKGYKTGLYTSPHLLDFRERIKVDGEMISQEGVLSFLQRYGEFISNESPSFFEITTAMALDWFSTCDVEYAVIETGLGGRLDSTNIITPELSIITSIGFDHKDILGDTLEKIAYEKGGIIKRGVPVVVGNVEEPVAKVLSDIAMANSSSISFSSNSEDIYEQLLSLDLQGEYQRENLKTVVSALGMLGIKADDSFFEALSHAASRTGLRGRWDVVSKHPTIICDIAHNEQGIKVNMSQLDRLYDEGDFCRLIFIFGVMADKDLDAIMEYLPINAIYLYVNASSSRALPIDALEEKMSLNGFVGQKVGSVKEAIELYRAGSEENDLVYIGGSSYVVAEALEWFDEEQRKKF